MRASLLLLALALVAPGLAAAAPAVKEVPYRTQDRMPDALAAPSPSQVWLGGYLGKRVLANEKARLLRVDEEPILVGFEKKPGSHPWIGEHAGKWLHAATLAWVYTGDPALKAKLDRVAARLVAAQEPDGYLGTYVPEKRFGLYPDADWDVWSHKYNLIGLLTYYHYTGAAPALAACRKMGDLLIRTFGPGRKSILSAGTHMGMAATSVLEPMVLLYRTTGDPRYLQFARYIVRSWDEPGGPAILKSLTAHRSVGQTANGKAYEMMSNLVGLCELARATGERRYLVPALNAWEDIVAHQRYLTGTVSYGEHFHASYDLPNTPSASVGETCATVTWLQLNAQLLRLTGAAKYANELERTYYNHLAAAQRPDGAEWCYYTALEGTKPYGPGISCCVSSGPRGMALIPQLSYMTGGTNRIVVNTLETSRFTTRLGGRQVTVDQKSGFPLSGQTTLTVHTSGPATFALWVRSPQWAAPMTLQLRGARLALHASPGGWAVMPARAWHDGDTVRVRFRLAAAVLRGDHGNQGKDALTWGPMVMAYESGLNTSLGSPARVALEAGAPAHLAAASAKPFALTAAVSAPGDTRARPAVFVPFAEAGGKGGVYRVWLRDSRTALAPNASVFAFGEESRSVPGNAEGSITDGDPRTYVVTFNALKQGQAWFGLRASQPVSFRRVVFAHGNSFHDGGWFDASAGKPVLEVQRTIGGVWERVGTLDSYPSTTATDSAGLRPGQSFTLRLDRPERALAIRVVGRPACGDNPAQSFASCGELQAFGE